MTRTSKLEMHGFLMRPRIIIRVTIVSRCINPRQVVLAVFNKSQMNLQGFVTASFNVSFIPFFFLPSVFPLFLHYLSSNVYKGTFRVPLVTSVCWSIILRQIV